MSVIVLNFEAIEKLYYVYMTYDYMTVNELRTLLKFNGKKFIMTINTEKFLELR